MKRQDRAELVEMARRILAVDGTEEELDALQAELESRVPMPGLNDLMFHHEPQLTAAEIIDRALAYRPIELGPPGKG